MLAIKKQPFRELPVRKKMAKPEWLPPKGDGEEPLYKLSLINGVYQMCRFEVRNSYFYSGGNYSGRERTIR